MLLFGTTPPKGRRYAMMAKSICLSCSKIAKVELYWFCRKGDVGVLLKSWETNVCETTGLSAYVELAETLVDAEEPFSVAVLLSEPLSATEVPMGVPVATLGVDDGFAI